MGISHFVQSQTQPDTTYQITVPCQGQYYLGGGEYATCIRADANPETKLCPACADIVDESRRPIPETSLPAEKLREELDMNRTYQMSDNA